MEAVTPENTVIVVFCWFLLRKFIFELVGCSLGGWNENQIHYACFKMLFVRKCCFSCTASTATVTITKKKCCVQRKWFSISSLNFFKIPISHNILFACFSPFVYLSKLTFSILNISSIFVSLSTCFSSFILFEFLFRFVSCRMH